jgi:hypothetical protein
MNFLLIIPYYFLWHYSQGVFDYFKVWRNLIWFLWNFFSIKILLKTFFTPFKRLKEYYDGDLNMESLVTSILVTNFMRVVGMVFRSVVIIFGLIILTLFIFGGLLGMIIWLFLPFILSVFIFVSLIALIK